MARLAAHARVQAFDFALRVAAGRRGRDQDLLEHAARRSERAAQECGAAPRIAAPTHQHAARPRAAPRRTRSGCANDEPQRSPAPTRRRAATAPMFENGSGEVLTAARVVALATWLVAASVPPSSAATAVQVAWSAPNTAGRERRAGRDAHHRVQQVPQACRRRGSCRRRTRRTASARSRPASRVLQQLQARRQRRPSRDSRPGRSGTAPRRGAAPLAQPSAAASATRWVVSRFIASIVRCASGLTPASQAGLRLLQEGSARLRGLRRWRGCRRCAARCRRAARRRSARPATSCTSCLQARTAIGPLATSAATISSTFASSASARTTSCTKPSACACVGAEALGRDEVARATPARRARGPRRG